MAGKRPTIPGIEIKKCPCKEMAAPEIDGRAYPKQVAAPKRFRWPGSAEMKRWPRPKYAHKPRVYTIA
jgi:hypothetical protein